GGRPYQTVEPWHEAPHLDLTDWLMWKPAYLGGLMIRREWLEQSGGFDETLVQAEDVDLLWRLARAGCRFGWLKEPTVGYRQHGENTVRNGRVQAQNLCRVLDKFFTHPDCPAAAKKLENRVRYYTLLWLAWQLFRTGGAEDVPDFLRQSLAHAHFPPELAVSHWLAQMAQFARQDGVVADLRRMWPAFRAASGLADGRWAELAPGLDWWLDVWRPYLDGDAAAAEANLAAYRRFSPRQLVQMAQSGVLVSPRLADTAVIYQFWAAARRLGLVTAADDGEVTALFLTTLAHALYQHRWRLAAKAAGYALRHTGRRRGMAAWGRFVTAAWAYYGGRP
ncbi:MAG: glycosyltransferase family 2 protein, partial [Anaerolineae bacterium]